MCEKCVNIDNAIKRYERIRSTIGDQLTIDRIKELVTDMRAQMVGFHPQEDCIER